MQSRIFNSRSTHHLSAPAHRIQQQSKTISRRSRSNQHSQTMASSTYSLPCSRHLQQKQQFVPRSIPHTKYTECSALSGSKLSSKQQGALNLQSLAESLSGWLDRSYSSTKKEEMTSVSNMLETAAAMPLGRPVICATQIELSVSTDSGDRPQVSRAMRDTRHGSDTNACLDPYPRDTKKQADKEKRQ